MAYDKYRSATTLSNLGSPAEHDAVWVGSDTGGSGSGDVGDIKGKLANDTVNVTFKGVAAGTLLPFEFKSINTTVTKCSEFVTLESGERYST